MTALLSLWLALAVAPRPEQGFLGPRPTRQAAEAWLEATPAFRGFALDGPREVAGGGPVPLVAVVVLDYADAAKVFTREHAALVVVDLTPGRGHAVASLPFRPRRHVVRPPPSKEPSSDDVEGQVIEKHAFDAAGEGIWRDGRYACWLIARDFVSNPVIIEVKGSTASPAGEALPTLAARAARRPVALPPGRGLAVEARGGRLAIGSRLPDRRLVVVLSGEGGPAQAHPMLWGVEAPAPYMEVDLRALTFPGTPQGRRWVTVLGGTEVGGPIVIGR